MARVIMINSVPRVRTELSLHGVNSVAHTARQAGVMAFRGSVRLERPTAPEDIAPEPDVVDLRDTAAEPVEAGVDHAKRELEPVEVAALGELGLESAVLVEV